MTKKITVLLASAAAAVAASASDYTVTVDAPFVSQYYFRGVKLDGASIQPSVELAYGDLTAGIWTSNGLSNWRSDNFSEVDIYGTYSFMVSEEIKVPVGFTWYYYPTLDLNSGFYRNTFEINAGLVYTFMGATLNPKAYYDFKLRQWTFEGNAGYTIPLEALGTQLDFSASIGYRKADKPYRKLNAEDRNAYYSVGVEVPYKLTDTARIYAGLAFVDGFKSKTKIGNTTSKQDLGPGRLIYSAGLSVAF